MAFSSTEILKEAGYGNVNNRLIKEWGVHNGGNVFSGLNDEKDILRSLYRAFLLLFLGAILVEVLQYFMNSSTKGSFSWELLSFIFTVIALAVVATFSIWNAFYLVGKLLSYRHSEKVGRMFRDDHSDFLTLLGNEPYGVLEWPEIQCKAKHALTKKAQNLTLVENAYKAGGKGYNPEVALKEFEAAFDLLCRFRLIEGGEGRNPFFKEAREDKKVSLTTVPSS